MSSVAIQPRIIRVGQAPAYCAMCDRVFKAEIRPHLTEIPIGKQGIGFDRFEIDLALDKYISRYGRDPDGKKENDKCKKPNGKPVVVSMTEVVSGTSTSKSQVSDFAKVLEQAKGKKRNATSRGGSKK